jgi:sugar O-acyltransferase (sialic acid O-acetyltransferase NeuD family)
MDNFLLFGASGHGKVVADCLFASGNQLLGIFDDNPNAIRFHEIPFLEFYNSSFHPESPLIISIGDNKTRKLISTRIKHSFKSVIHPSAILGKGVIMGLGTVLLHGAIVQADVVIGNHCIVNTRASIDHDCVLSDFVHISPSATLCGGVVIGEGSQIGAGAVVIQNISIGKWVTIGAGSVIVNDVPDNAVVVGNPGRILKYKEL